MEKFERIELVRKKGRFNAAFVVGRDGGRIELPLIAAKVSLDAHTLGRATVSLRSSYIQIVEA